MKFNVSVPDDLWEAALTTSTVGSSPSAVIQDALRKVTSRQEPDLDDEARALFEAARDEILESAQSQYQAGYKYGLRLAHEIGDWQRLKETVELGIVATVEKDLVRVKAELADGTYPRGGRKSLFVHDERTDTPRWESGEDADGEWFIDHDPTAYWLSCLMIMDDGTLVHGDIGPNQLVVNGTEAALRDVLAHGTPR